jgi:hypothetical protein
VRIRRDGRDALDTPALFIHPPTHSFTGIIALPMVPA